MGLCRRCPTVSGGKRIFRDLTNTTEIRRNFGKNLFAANRCTAKYVKHILKRRKIRKQSLFSPNTYELERERAFACRIRASATALWRR